MARATSAYDAYLQSRWRPRGRTLALTAVVSTPAWVLLDVLHGQLFSHPVAWQEAAAARLPLLPLPLLGLALLLLAPAWRGLPAAFVALSVCFLLGVEWGFFRLGTALGGLHVAAVLLTALAPPALLPLHRRGRLGLYALVFCGHALLMALLPVGEGGGTLSPGQRLWGVLLLALPGAALVPILDLLFTSHRRGFELRLRMQGALEELEHFRERVGEAAGTLSGSVGALAEGARALAAGSARSEERAHAVAEATGEVARAARALEDRSRGGATLATQTHAQAADVEGLLGSVEEGVQAIGGAVQSAQERFRQLEERARRIGSFVEMVQGIAARTQMLALNAGIEAQRAGAHGKGFGVIAREVRQLAQQSGAGSQEVAQVVEALRREMADAHGAVDQVRERTARFLSVHARSRETLLQVQDSVALTGAAMQDNARDAAGQAAATQHISGDTAQLRALISEQARLAARVDATSAELGAIAFALRALLPRAEGPGALHPLRADTGAAPAVDGPARTASGPAATAASGPAATAASGPAATAASGR
jgi:methyl-accepting chemotaxis protein